MGPVGQVVGGHTRPAPGDGPRASVMRSAIRPSRGQSRLITDRTSASGPEAGLDRPQSERCYRQESVSVPVGPEPLAIVSADRATRRARRFVHRPKTMAVWEGRSGGLADFGLLHFEPKVVALARAFADAGKHGIAAVLAGDAGDQLGEDDRLADAGAAEQAGLAAADQRRQQVDDLDARLEDLRLGRQFGEGRRIAVDGPELGRMDRSAPVDRLAEQVEDAPQRLLADGHGHGSTGVGDRHAADQAVGRAEGHAADAVAAQVLLHLAGQADGHALEIALDAQGVVDLRQMAGLELGVEGRADDLDDFAGFDRWLRPWLLRLSESYLLPFLMSSMSLAISCRRRIDFIASP